MSIRENTHIQTHTRADNEIHPSNMHSLPDRDKICYSVEMGELSHQFRWARIQKRSITEAFHHQTSPTTCGALRQNGSGGSVTEEGMAQRQATDSTGHHAPSRCPLSQRCSVSGQDTSGEQAGYWLTESKSRSVWRNMLMNGCGFLENYGNICLSLFIFRFAFGIMCESTHNAN